jgi:hypothetical protein
VVARHGLGPFSADVESFAGEGQFAGLGLDLLIADLLMVDV